MGVVVFAAAAAQKTNPDTREKPKAATAAEGAKRKKCCSVWRRVKCTNELLRNEWAEQNIIEMSMTTTTNQLFENMGINDIKMTGYMWLFGWIYFVCTYRRRRRKNDENAFSFFSSSSRWKISPSPLMHFYTKNGFCGTNIVLPAAATAAASTVHHKKGA